MNYTILGFKSFLLGKDYNSASSDLQKGIDSDLDILVQKKQKSGQDVNLILNNAENQYYIIAELDIDQDLVVVENGEF